MNWGVELLQSSALPLGYGTIWSRRVLQKFGASDEARTRYLHLGKVALYQMSYTRNNSDYYSKESKNVKYKMKKVFWGRNKTNRPYVLQTCC